MRHSTRRFVLLLAGLFSAVAIACGTPADQKPDPTSTSEPPAPPDAAAIQSLDLAQVAAVQGFMRQIGGGELDKASVQYADLTKDGRDEAIVPVSSGGTLGNLGYVVLTLRSGSPAAILTAQRDRNSIGGVTLNVEDGKLVKYIGKYGPEDPRCCPTLLVKTTYYWDGANLQVEREDEIKAGNQKQ